MSTIKKQTSFQKNNLLISTGLLLLLLFSSCALTPLQGKYPDSYSYTSSSSKDKIWDNLVDYFTKNSIKITTIDKASGLIISSQYSFMNTYTQEDTLGHLINPNAWVVGNFKLGANYDEGLNITGNINVHLFEENGSQKLEVSITGLNMNRTMPKNSSVNSTGAMEKEIGKLLAQ